MLPGNAFDFHERVHGESGNLNSGTGGLVIAERLLVDLVDDGKVIHGFEEHGRFYNFSHITSRGLNHRTEVLEYLFRLFFDTASNELPGRGIERDVP